MQVQAIFQTHRKTQWPEPEMNQAESRNLNLRQAWIHPWHFVLNFSTAKCCSNQHPETIEGLRFDTMIVRPFPCISLSVLESAAPSAKPTVRANEMAAWSRH